MNKPTNKTFQCRFCKADLPIILRKIWDEDHDNIGQCQSCGVYYELDQSDGTISSLYLAHGDFFLMFEEDNTFVLSTVDDDYNENIILTLPYWPDNITPQNLDEKIKLFKTFG
jgi:transcription elongation factor Elf1